jgi:hypothetical protein
VNCELGANAIMIASCDSELLVDSDDAASKS